MWLRRFLLVGPVVLALLLGLVLAFPLFMLRPHPLAAAVWPGSPGTRWAGAELRGMDVLGHKGIVREQFLELRCRRLPVLKTKVEYWPGPEWHGWAEWNTDRVTYQPGWKASTPTIKPGSIAAPWWLRRCPS